jgi:hypothetical protein
MKIMRICTLLTGIASVAAAFGQTPAQGQTGQPFSITISAVRSEVKSGIPVRVKIHLTNTSDREMSETRRHLRGFNANYEYDIRDSAGNRLQTKPLSPAESQLPPDWDVSVSSIAPRGSLDDIATLSREYDLSVPGEYTIQLSRHIEGKPDGEVVRSNTITITVLPAGTPAHSE